MLNSIPQYIKEHYPFGPKKFKTSSGANLSYVDEGADNERIVFLVHGNPTWSFYYRNLIKELSHNHRVIAVDNIGCGLSDKPQKYDYTLAQHIQNIEELFQMLAPQNKSDLIIHDWGGAIGMGLATKYPEKFDKIVILNTAAFTDKKIPKRINICKFPILGEKIVRSFNAFAYPATFMAVRKKLPMDIKKAYLYPYDNYQNRIATARFVQDIPMKEEHPTWQTLKSIENNLHNLKGKKLILWGAKDFCFSTHFFNRWKNIYPDARHKLYSDAGHYVLEDESCDTTKRIKDFLGHSQ